MCETVSWWQFNLSMALNSTTAISTDTTDFSAAVAAVDVMTLDTSVIGTVNKRKALLPANAVLSAKKSRHSAKSTTVAAERIEDIIVPKRHTQTHIGLFVL